jgi:ribosomal protein S18 acetylase RimI-like enzyme
MIQFRRLSPNDFERIREAMSDSFADYAVAIDCSEKALYERFIRVNVNYNLSGAFFEAEKMVSFVLHGRGIFNAKAMLYNAGTGTIPEHRGNKLTEKIYAEMLPELRQDNYFGVLLEVTENNERAKKVYEKIGFQITRKLNCYVLSSANTYPRYKATKTFNFHLKRPDLEQLSLFMHENADTIPSWQNTLESIERSPEEKSLTAWQDNALCGALIFNPNNGRISQICVRRDMREKGIASALIEEVKNYCTKGTLSVINIDESAEGLNALFVKSGFKLLLRQNEMLLPF